MKYKPKYNPYRIVQHFEEELANYCGSPFVVTVDSCTSALFLCCKYLNVKEVTIPNKTYLSVPQSIIHAGGSVTLKDEDWLGYYKLDPYPIFDSALHLTSGMYIEKSYMCLSFHYKKHIPIGKGGAILTDDEVAVEWFRRARYEGRNEKSYWFDEISELGWNMYMTPTEASLGLTLMINLDLDNEDIVEENGYRNLSEYLKFLKKS